MWLISELNDGNLAIVWVSYCQQYILFHGVAHLWVAENSVLIRFFQYEGHLKQVQIKLHIFEKKWHIGGLVYMCIKQLLGHSYSAFGHLLVRYQSDVCLSIADLFFWKQIRETGGRHWRTKGSFGKWTFSRMNEVELFNGLRSYIPLTRKQLL
jgi:hypothetical protein